VREKTECVLGGGKKETGNIFCPDCSYCEMMITTGHAGATMEERMKGGTKAEAVN
jgi:hypothetical protein